MQKLSTAEAVKVITVSESTLRRDLKSGKLSFTTDKNGKKQIDVSELERVYGQLTISETQKNGTDSEKVVSLLEGQVQDLKAQLEIATTEKTKLLDLLSAEKAEKAGTHTTSTKKKRRNLQTGCSGSSVPDSFPSSQKATCLFFCPF